MSRPALAYVVNSLNPGGTEKLVVDMSLAFSTDFEVVVICLDEPGLWATNLREKNIPVYCIWRQPGLDMNILVRLAHHFRRHRTNIIHAHQCSAWFYSALSRVLYSTPLLLLEEHGRFFPEVENKKRAFVNRLIIRRLTHRFVAVSNDVRTRLQRYEGLKKDRIDVVYNGVKAEPAISQNERARRRAELGFGPEEFIVGTVGRFDPIKNLPLFVKSLANLKNEAPATLGLLVGDGPVLPEISEMVKRLGLSDRVSLPGHRDDARQLIPCMDLFVLSSFSEGTSMALLEAMAAGVPTLVTDVGGNPEIIVKNQTGWLVPSDSVEDLTAAITDAVNNPSKRQKFAQAGKRRFEERFTFDIMIDNYRKIYNEMIEDRKR